MKDFNCTSYSELYSKLEVIAIEFMGLDEVPFSLSEIEHPPAELIAEMVEFLCQGYKAVDGDNSDKEAIKHIQFLEKKIIQRRAMKIQKCLIMKQLRMKRI